MKEKRSYINSYVAYIDILGFKNYINNNDFESVSKLFSNIQNIRETALHFFGRNAGKETITINVISDSIIISVPKTTTNSFFLLLFITNEFVFTILLEHNLLCRGAIVEGEFYAKENIAFGPAFVEAYLLENETAVYPRIIFTQKTFDSFIENCGKSNPNTYHFLRIFISKDLKDHLFYADYIKHGLHDTSIKVEKK